MAAEGQFAESCGRQTGEELIVESLAAASAVAREGIGARGRPWLETRVPGILASWPDWGLIPVEAMNTPARPGSSSSLPFTPRVVWAKLFWAMPKWACW